jgi:hypothetical protein
MASRAKLKAARWTEIGPLHIHPEIVEDFGGRPPVPEKDQKSNARPRAGKKNKKAKGSAE